MGLMELIKLIAMLLPVIHQIVLLVEGLFPNAGQGARKLDAAVGIIESVLPTVGVAADQASQIAANLRPVISGVVSALNLAGALDRSSSSSVNDVAAAPSVG